MNKQIVDLETQNLADSKQVQMVSLERYKVGKANLLETIETQKNLEDAQVRYINALYSIKLAGNRIVKGKWCFGKISRILSGQFETYFHSCSNSNITGLYKIIICTHF